MLGNGSSHHNGSNKHVLYKHENGERTFSCELCPKKYASSKTLRDHVKRIHSTTYDFPCDNCDSKFKVQRVLQKHKKDQHNQVREKITCNVCLKQVYCKSKLLVHHKTHMEKIKCDECNMLIAYSNKRRHIRIKHSQTPSQQMHSCNVCNKTLKSSISLKSHILNHHTSRARDYTCQTCNNAFMSPKYLQSHQITHTSEKPYECVMDDCEKSYNNPGSLSRHKRSHM